MMIKCTLGQYNSDVPDGGVYCYDGTDQKECERCGWNQYERDRRMAKGFTDVDGLEQILIPPKTSEEWREK